MLCPSATLHKRFVVERMFEPGIGTRKRPGCLKTTSVSLSEVLPPAQSWHGESAVLPTVALFPPVTSVTSRAARVGFYTLMYSPTVFETQLISLLGVSTYMKNTFTNTLLALAVGGLLLVGSASAQTSTTTSGAGPGVVDPGHPRVNEVNGREENQQQRIANGVSSGKLNAQQTSNLEKREASVQNREQKDMAANNGHLTKGEQRRINRQQNRISKSIYKDKHEASK